MQMSHFKHKIIIQEDNSISFGCAMPQSIKMKYNGNGFPIDPLNTIIPTNHSNINRIETQAIASSLSGRH